MKGWFFEHFSAWPRPFSLRMLHPTAMWVVVPCRGLARNLVGCWRLGGHRSATLVARSAQHGGRCGLEERDELPADLLKNRACMVAMVEREGDVCRETVRGIVVHDRWPQP